MDILAQRAAKQQQDAAGLYQADAEPEPPAPPIYGPGGAERPRLLTDIVTAVASPDLEPEQITERAQALIDWIDSHD